MPEEVDLKGRPSLRSTVKLYANVSCSKCTHKQKQMHTHTDKNTNTHTDAHLEQKAQDKYRRAELVLFMEPTGATLIDCISIRVQFTHKHTFAHAKATQLRIYIHTQMLINTHTRINTRTSMHLQTHQYTQKHNHK